MQAASENKTSLINVRVGAKEKAIIQQASTLSGMNMSAFILNEALSYAKKILEEKGQMILDDEDRVAFINAFLEPHEPTPYMKDALKKYKAI